MHGPILTSLPDDAPLTRRFASQGRLTHRPAKGNAFRRTRGAFRHRMNPVRGSATSSTICPQPVEWWSSAFSIFVRPPP
jgi:hypothetical protein